MVLHSVEMSYSVLKLNADPIRDGNVRKIFIFVKSILGEKMGESCMETRSYFVAETLL